MPLPSSTAATIEAKLSSDSTISADSLATSVPVMPMATPMSARFSAGASLTPSPVIATIWPSPCSASTMRTFCSGATRANTLTSLILRASSSSLMDDSSCPVIDPPGEGMPISLAIASAVNRWSPVIMMTLMPAVRHRATASAASFRGESIMPTSPRKVRSLSSPSP